MFFCDFRCCQCLTEAFSLICSRWCRRRKRHKGDRLPEQGPRIAAVLRGCTYLDGHSVAALRGDDAVVSVFVDLVVVDGQVVAVVVGVETVLGVVVHLIPPPVSLLVAVRVDSEVVVVDVGVVDVAVDVHLVEHLRVTSVFAEPSYLATRAIFRGLAQAYWGQHESWTKML